MYPQSKKEADETAETLTRNPNNLKLTQLTKVLIHNQLADKAKARLPTFSHNLHLVAHCILLALNNMHQITTCRLFDSIQFCVCLIPRNAPHFFVSTSAIPDNRCLTEWVLSVKTRLLTDKLLVLNNLSVKPHLFTDNLSIFDLVDSIMEIIPDRGNWRLLPDTIASVRHDLREKPNNLKLPQPTKVLIHNYLVDNTKARLPTFSHNLHLADHHILLTISTIH